VRSPRSAWSPARSSALREARLLAQVEGAVNAVLVEEGDAVRRGQPLVRLDATIQEAEASAARSAAATARADLDRTRRLVQLGAAAQATLEQSTTQLREAESQLRIAQQRAGYAVVRAPFDGVVTARAVDAGDVAAVGQALLTVADTRELRAEVPVSELDVVALRANDRAAVDVDALPGRSFAGRIRRVFPTVDPVTRQALVEVVVPTRGTPLRPGFLSRITLVTARVDGAVAVPVDAVRRDVNDRPYVFVLAADTLAVRRPVQLGITAADNQVEIARGLRAGERVVVGGHPAARRHHRGARGARLRGRPRRPRRRGRERRAARARRPGERRTREPVSAAPPSAERPAESSDAPPAEGAPPARPGDARATRGWARLASWAIDHPIGTWTVALILGALGLVLFTTLRIDLLPQVVYPVIRVSLVNEGADPRVLEETGTRELEKGLAATENVTRIESTTREGQASVLLEFDYSADVEAALADASANLDQIRSRLPEEADAPTIFKIDPSASPVIELAITSPALDLVRLRDFAEEELADLLITVPGVAAGDHRGRPRARDGGHPRPGAAARPRALGGRRGGRDRLREPDGAGGEGHHRAARGARPHRGGVPLGGGARRARDSRSMRRRPRHPRGAPHPASPARRAAAPRPPRTRARRASSGCATSAPSATPPTSSASSRASTAARP
jgi:membrane fusion protein (multidrug efflux system)